MNKVEINKITKYIFIGVKPQKADLAIIFGTRHQESLLKAFELYRDGFIPRILLSGGVNKETKKIEAEEMARHLIEMGVEERDLILENKSTSTLENVLFSKRIIEKVIGFDNIKKIILIVKHYHSRRAAMTAKRYFPAAVKLIPITYEIYGFTKKNWYESELGRKKVLNEWKKIPKYLSQRHIEELSRDNY